VLGHVWWVSVGVILVLGQTDRVSDLLGALVWTSLLLSDGGVG